MHSTALPEDEQVKEPVTGEVPGTGLPAGVLPPLPTIEQLLMEAAIQRPEGEALIGTFGSLTYADLLIRAQNIAVALRRQGVRPGQFVGVAMDQSPVMVTSIVGVLLAGAAYVPLGRDLLQDAAALKSIRATGMALILCDRSHGTGSCLVWSELGAVLDASRLEQQTMPTSNETSMPTTTADAAAAVFFRRLPGSEVAGVVIPHRAVARLALGKRLVRFHSTETFLLHPFSSLRPALLELWGSLLSGATLALAPDGPVQQPGGMLHVNLLALTIRQFGVSTLCLPVSSLHGLIYDSPQIFSRLNNLVIQNEQDSTLSPQRLQWLAGNHPRLRIVHTYGTIETSGYALSYTVPRAYQAQASVPVGQPIDGMQARILDRELFPAREGEIGELALSGDGVARGYLNNLDATAARFLHRADTGRETAGMGVAGSDAYLFLTGERARWRSDGLLEMHGPAASHAGLSAQPDAARGKVPKPAPNFGAADVEAMLMSQQGIRDAAIVEEFDELGQRRQIAFVALDLPGQARPKAGQPLPKMDAGRVQGDSAAPDSVSAQSIFEQSMRSALPPAAMPSVFRYVESIPRNVAGDPDRELLEQRWAIEKDRAERDQQLEKGDRRRRIGKRKC